MSNSNLLSILARDLDNTTNVIGYVVGEENNLDRFFYELFMLFKRSYSKAEFDDIARNTPDKNKYYFYSIHKHNLSSLCDRNITDVTKVLLQLKKHLMNVIL
jgi:hypothetical protein